MKPWLIVILVFIASCAALLFGGCATTGTYATCEERAAKHGVVLECKETLVYRDGQRVTRCLVSTPDGDKFHYYKSCGPESARPLESY
jgi:hypothetical protein